MGTTRFRFIITNKHSHTRTHSYREIQLQLCFMATEIIIRWISSFLQVDLFSAYCRGMQMMLYVLMLSTSCRLLLATLYDDDGVIIKYRMPLTQHLLGSDQRLFSLNHCRVEQGRSSEERSCGVTKPPSGHLHSLYFVFRAVHRCSPLDQHLINDVMNQFSESCEKLLIVSGFICQRGAGGEIKNCPQKNQHK